MQILLVSATAFEVEPILLKLQQSPVASLTVEPLITGVGVLPAAFTITRSVCQKKPDLIIQAGIAGAFGSFNPGDVFAISTEALADVGVLENGKFLSPFDLRLANENDFPFTSGLLPNPHAALIKLSDAKAVPAITVQEITADVQRMERHQQKYAPVVESMEGAALHYCGLMLGIPFIQLRSISNQVGERDKSKWHIAKAMKSLAETVYSLFEKISVEDEINAWL